MNKQYIQASNDQFNRLLKKFIGEFGLPQIKRNFSVYAFNNIGDEFHVNYIDQKCDIKLIPVRNKNRVSTPPIYIQNKNLKRLFETVSLLGFESANIGFIISLNFNISDTVQVSFLSNSFADNLIELKFVDETSELLSKVRHIIESNNLITIDKIKLKAFLGKKKIKRESIFDKFGCLNSKIRKFGDMTGIDVMSDAKTIKNRIKKFSNDYSIYEEWFQKLVGTDINGLTGNVKVKGCFKPVSIIIPCYNSNSTITKTLYSIESQNLDKDSKSQIEVIVVDDGSTLPVYKTLLPHLDDFTFNLKVIRLEKNSGLSTARNVGISSSKNDYLILLDSDVLIPENYVMEHLVRNQLIPHAVFVSFKKNIDPEDQITNIETIKKGLKSPNNIDDLRISKDIKKDQIGIHRTPENMTIEILNDTDYFRSFGYGRVIGIFDLATMVIGHNLTICRKTMDKTGYFSNKFNGWGLEDSFFGANLISNGNYVIPVLSSNVYHINHPPRSGSEEIKQKEFKKNLELYNDLLEKDY